MPEIENFDEAEPAPERPARHEPGESFETARPVAPPRPARAATKPAGMPPGRQMPASEEAEQHVIACCLLDGSDTIIRCLEARIAPDSFFWPGNQLLFQTIVELHKKGQLVTLEVLVEELSTRRLLDEAGGLPYLMQVTGKAPTTAHAGYFIEKVREKHLLREAIKVHTGAVEAAYNFDGGLEEFIQITRARLDAISRIGTAKDSLPTPRRIRLSEKPGEPSTRLFLAGKPIATPGNLVTLISKAKTGKTAAIGAATAAIVGAHYSRTDLDTFKFSSSHTDEAVILIDTEQSPFDAWTCHSRLLARSGGEQDPDWLLHYALVGYSAKQLRDTLASVVESAASRHRGVFTIILDGVADFVMSVNDEAECNEFITWLRAMAVKYDCPIICVIHSNEAQKSGDDGRGHLGKQLTRKAESNLLLKKEGDVTTITSEKQRKAPITEKDGVAFRWSDELQRHVSCEMESSDKPRGGRRKLHDIATFMEFIPAKGQKGRTAGQLFNYAKEISPIKVQTFRDLLNGAVETGDLLRSLDPQLGYTYNQAK